MLRKAPSWWYGKGRLMPMLLSPAALLYGAVSGRRLRQEGYRSRLPVICIGNFTAGGSGKTPAAIAIAEILKEQGANPAFLSRGYGGRTAGPHVVEPASDTAIDVGDEPLLLGRVASVVVAADRAAGARLIEQSDATHIIMDDGFQNPGLKKDMSIIAIDAETGIGNAHVIPAGPLRAPLSVQIGLADALLVIGRGTAADDLASRFQAMNKPVLRASLEPDGDMSSLKREKVIAFAGIARPEKFFLTLESLGAEVLERHVFSDHHTYTQEDAANLLKRAGDTGAHLVTTEKDHVRLPHDGPLDWLRRDATVIKIKLQFENEQEPAALLEIMLSTATD